MPCTILGGALGPPISLSIAGKLPVSAEDVARNIAHARGLGLPTYRDVAPARAPWRLAVVGGGPSIELHTDALRAFDGDVWAINGAWGWCRARGIAATFFAVDPDPIVARWCAGARKALLEIGCDPAVFALLGRADVTVFDVDHAAGGIVARGSTATAAPHLAFRMGYRSVTFFGCESCYRPDATHAYMREPRSEEMLIECGGAEYLTAPDFYIQAIELSRFIRALPEFLSEESGGLLRAMVADPEFHVRWVSDELARNIKALSGPPQAA